MQPSNSFPAGKGGSNVPYNPQKFLSMHNMSASSIPREYYHSINPHLHMNHARNYPEAYLQNKTSFNNAGSFSQQKLNGQRKKQLHFKKKNSMQKSQKDLNSSIKSVVNPIEISDDQDDLQEANKYQQTQNKQLGNAEKILSQKEKINQKQIQKSINPTFNQSNIPSFQNNHIFYQNNFNVSGKNQSSLGPLPFDSDSLKYYHYGSMLRDSNVNPNFNYFGSSNIPSSIPAYINPNASMNFYQNKPLENASKINNFGNASNHINIPNYQNYHLRFNYSQPYGQTNNPYSTNFNSHFSVNEMSNLNNLNNLSNLNNLNNLGNLTHSAQAIKKNGQNLLKYQNQSYLKYMVNNQNSLKSQVLPERKINSQKQALKEQVPKNSITSQKNSIIILDSDQQDSTKPTGKHLPSLMTKQDIQKQKQMHRKTKGIFKDSRSNPSFIDERIKDLKKMKQFRQRQQQNTSTLQQKQTYQKISKNLIVNKSQQQLKLYKQKLQILQNKFAQKKLGQTPFLSKNGIFNKVLNKISATKIDSLKDNNNKNHKFFIQKIKEKQQRKKSFLKKQQLKKNYCNELSESKIIEQQTPYIEWTARLRRIRQLNRKRQNYSQIMNGPQFQAILPEFLSPYQGNNGSQMDKQLMIHQRKTNLLSRLFTV